MPLKQRGGEGTRAGECRRCRTFCDKLIEPRGCVEMGCPYLYSYDDELSGRRYLGCLNRVFGCEIDVDAFEAAERSGGYGGVKMTGKAMPHCQFTVEPCYEGAGKDYECINPRFFDCTDEGAHGLRVFDLRDAIAEA
jgi:hypothetical protein